MSKYVIAHGQMQEIRDDELMHIAVAKGEPRKDHKYISREWKNNRWVYTYKNDSKNSSKGYSNQYNSLYDAAKANAAAKKSAEKADKVDKFKGDVRRGLTALKTLFTKPIGLNERKEYKEAEKKLSDTKSNTATAKMKYDTARDKAYEDNHLADSEKTNISTRKNDYDKQLAAYKKAGEQYVKEQNEYFQTPIGKIEEFSLKAKEFFSNIFGKSEYENLENEAKAHEEELERQKKGEYVEAQTKERNGIRTEELNKLLEKYNEPEEWHEKLFNIRNNPLPELVLKQSATTLDDDMALVNPNYKTAKNSFDQNCGACSITYELRRRGYDVEVVSESEWLKAGGSMQDIADCFKGSEIITLVDIKEKYNVAGTAGGLATYVTKDILSHGEGARGNLGLAWKSGGGHSIAWEIENGKVVYRDCQTNEKIDFAEWAHSVDNINYIRTDNLEVTEECYQYVRNRRSDKK